MLPKGAVSSGTTLFAIPFASLGCIPTFINQTVPLLGQLQ